MSDRDSIGTDRLANSSLNYMCFYLRLDVLMQFKVLVVVYVEQTFHKMRRV